MATSAKAIIVGKTTITKSINFTLAASDWSDGAQTVYLSTYVTASTNGVFAPAQSITAEQLEAWSAGKLMVTSQGAQNANDIVVTAFGDTPTVDLPATLLIIGG